MEDNLNLPLQRKEMFYKNNKQEEECHNFSDVEEPSKILFLDVKNDSDQQELIYELEESEKSDSSQPHINNPNVLKNIIKSFFKFLTENANLDIIQHFIPQKSYKDSIREIKKYIKRYKFNNQFLIRLIKCKSYSRIFEYYLTFDVADWLVESKICDIDRHKESIYFLKGCCVNQELIKLIPKKNKY